MWKNAIFSVLPNEEISLWPELSSPLYFRIQGRSRERDEVQSPDGPISVCLILDCTETDVELVNFCYFSEHNFYLNMSFTNVVEFS